MIFKDFWNLNKKKNIVGQILVSTLESRVSINNFILLKYCWLIMWHNLCHCSLFFDFISRWGQYGFNLDWFHSHIANDCWKWIWWTINFGRNNQGNNHSCCLTYSWNEGFHSRNHMIRFNLVGNRVSRNLSKTYTK